MGHASSIALGIAVSKPQIRVWCFDGDGAVLMHLGSLPVIANIEPKNFLHVVFDNGAHDSVGGQLTLLGKSDLTGIAREAGYARAYTASSEEQISEKLEQMLAFPGPGLLVIKVKTGSRSDLGRPRKTPSQLKSILMKSF
jgi:phosphonopyruvate decarboxylase